MQKVYQVSAVGGKIWVHEEIKSPGSALEISHCSVVGLQTAVRELATQAWSQRADVLDMAGFERRATMIWISFS